MAFENARVAEVADAPDVGSGTSVCGFDSHPSHLFLTPSFFTHGDNMTASIKETSSTTRNVEITIPQEALKAPFERKVTHYRKEVQLKGFRAGNVPRNIIINRFGKTIRGEVIE